MAGRTALALLAALLAAAAADPGGEGAVGPGPGPEDTLPDDSAGDSSETQMMAVGTGAAAMGNHGKFFQYGHHDGKDHYEFGFRRGNEHHFQERHEKAAPKHGHFNTKVRWGDKHGGYGEHYWDYNHAGHDDGDGGGEGSAPVPEYSASSPAESERNRERDDPRSQYKRQSQPEQAAEAGAEPGASGPNPRTYRNKYVPGKGGPGPGPGPAHRAPTPAPAPVTAAPAPPPRRPALGPKHADFMFPASTTGFLGHSPRDDFNPSRLTRQTASPQALRRLVFNTHTGLVHDEDTGKVYALLPTT